MAKSRRRVRAPVLPVRVNDEALSPVQIVSFRAAEAEETSADFAARARAAAKFRALEQDLEQRASARALSAGVEDSLSLARARGEEISLKRHGEGLARIRISSRDGLESLARSGALSAVQFRAGLLYRTLYEASDPERDLRSQMSARSFLQGGGHGVSSGQPEAWAERRLRLSSQMAGLEAKVRVADRNGYAVIALRQIAGHARVISQLSASGGGQAAYRRALFLALDIVADHFRVR